MRPSSCFSGEVLQLNGRMLQDGWDVREISLSGRHSTYGRLETLQSTRWHLLAISGAPGHINIASFDSLMLALVRLLWLIGDLLDTRTLLDTPDTLSLTHTRVLKMLVAPLSQCDNPRAVKGSTHTHQHREHRSRCKRCGPL